MDAFASMASNDSGLQQVMSSLSREEIELIQKILADPNSISSLFDMLPEVSQNQISNFISEIFNTPHKALSLYKQCRFFEARKLLIRTIDIFSNPPNTLISGLDTVVNFVTRRVKALCYELLGRVEWELGKSANSFKYHKIAYDIAVEIEDADTTAKALLGIGIFHWHHGRLQKGEGHLLNALEYVDKTDDQWETKNKILTSLCTLYQNIGEYDKAIEFSQRALNLSQKAADYSSYALCLNNHACLLADHGNYREAQTYLEAGLEILKVHKDTGVEALLLNNMAMLTMQHGQRHKAFEQVSSLLGRALDFGVTANSYNIQAMTLHNLGIFHQDTGDIKQARDSFGRALSLFHRIGSRLYEAKTMMRIGRLLEQDLGAYEDACEYFKKAVSVIEKTRATFKKESYRISYASIEAEPYELIINNLLYQGRTGEALEYVERSKSRALVDLLCTKLHKHTNPNNPEKLEQALRLLNEIEEIQTTLENIASREMPSSSDSSRSDNLIDSLIRNLRIKEDQFQSCSAELTISDPAISSLLKVQPFSINDIQGQLDEHTLFLELFQANDQLHLLALSGTGPPRAVKIPVLTLQEAWQTVQALMVSFKQKTGLDVRSHDFIRHIRKPLSQLYDLLILPFKREIATSERLIFSPHLFWHYLPFHALYDKEHKNYLCDQIEISFTPSASILSLCKSKERTEREKALILCHDNGDLPHVFREGELLAGAFYPHADLAQKDIASLSILKQAHRFDVVHFACHGRYVPDQPFLSGISIPPHPDSKRQSYLLDFFDHDLDCSLVTLSACESGLTSYTNGDELIGMGRTIFAAGAAAIMVSLWEVADSSTCYFMENFYWHYGKNKKTKTKALQLAMQAVKSVDKWAHPYFWAPFIIMGDWR